MLVSVLGAREKHLCRMLKVSHAPFRTSLFVFTCQVRLGQKSIPTGLVYKQNEEVLEEVGAAHLQKMLETRDWTGLEGKKVRSLA